MSEINACFDSKFYSLRMKQRSNTMRYGDTPTRFWGLKDVAAWNETCLLHVFCVDLWTWRCIASRLLLWRRLALVWSEPCKHRPILSMSGNCFQQNSWQKQWARTEGKGAETSGPGENEPDTQSSSITDADREVKSSKSSNSKAVKSGPDIPSAARFHMRMAWHPAWPESIL